MTGLFHGTSAWLGPMAWLRSPPMRHGSTLTGVDASLREASTDRVGSYDLSLSAGPTGGTEYAADRAYLTDPLSPRRGPSRNGRVRRILGEPNGVEPYRPKHRRGAGLRHLTHPSHRLTARVRRSGAVWSMSHHPAGKAIVHCGASRPSLGSYEEPTARGAGETRTGRSGSRTGLSLVTPVRRRERLGQQSNDPWAVTTA